MHFCPTHCCSASCCFAGSPELHKPLEAPTKQQASSVHSTLRHFLSGEVDNLARECHGPRGVGSVEPSIWKDTSARRGVEPRTGSACLLQWCKGRSRKLHGMIREEMEPIRVIEDFCLEEISGPDSNMLGHAFFWRGVPTASCRLTSI